MSSPMDHSDVPAPPQSIEDVIKSLVGFSQVVSKSMCVLQDAIGNLTTTVEAQAGEIAQLRKLIKSAADHTLESQEMKSDLREPNEIDESEEECAALLNKMQMRRDALKNPASMTSQTSSTPAAPDCKKESSLGAAKATILAAAKHLAETNS